MASSHTTDEPTGAQALEQRLARFRALRRELEAAVLPLATSIDGRRFSFQASLHGLELRLGGYVVLEYDGSDRLGQILALELDQREGTELDLPGDEDGPVGVRTQVVIRHARGEGTILEGDGTPVHDATVRPATGDEVRAWLERTRPRRAALPIGELSPAAQAALMRLDPIADRDEHAELTDLLEEGTPPSVDALSASPRPEAQRLALRARNLGVERFALWAGGQSGSLLDVLDDAEARCIVVDLGSLATREEQALAAEAVLGRLWLRREEREPVLVVIDEAHNVCPARPEDPLTALATGHAVRISAEGRKFGLYLVISTQRPQKVHENVISQCDNLVLMRLNSAADAAFAQAVFSFVPPSLIGQAARFGLGEALIAGKISPHPALIRFGARLAEEGGSDVPATWAEPR